MDYIAYCRYLLTTYQLSQEAAHLIAQNFSIDTYAGVISNFQSNRQLQRFVILLEDDPNYALMILKTEANYKIQILGRASTQQDLLKMNYIIQQITPNTSINFQPSGETELPLVFAHSLLQFLDNSLLGPLHIDVSTVKKHHQKLIQPSILNYLKEAGEQDLQQIADLSNAGNHLLKYMLLYNQCQNINLINLDYQQCQTLKYNFEQAKFTIFSKDFTFDEILEAFSWEGLVKFITANTAKSKLQLWETAGNEYQRALKTWEEQLDQQMRLVFSWRQLAKYHANHLNALARQITFIEIGGQFGSLLGNFYSDKISSTTLGQLINNIIPSTLSYVTRIFTRSHDLAEKVKRIITQQFQMQTNAATSLQWIGYGLGLYASLNLGSYLIMKNILINIVASQIHYNLMHFQTSHPKASIHKTYLFKITDLSVLSRSLLLLVAGIESIYYANHHYFLQGVGGAAGSWAAVKFARQNFELLNQTNDISKREEIATLNFVISMLGMELGRQLTLGIDNHLQMLINKNSLCASLQAKAASAKIAPFDGAEFKCNTMLASTSFWISRKQDLLISWSDESAHFETSCEAQVNIHSVNVTCGDVRVKYLLT